MAHCDEDEDMVCLSCGSEDYSYSEIDYKPIDNKEHPKEVPRCI